MFHSVREIDNWSAITKLEVERLRTWIKEENVDLDTGEKEIMEEERMRHEEEERRERMKGAWLSSSDILSQMFGPSFQEGEGFSPGQGHLLENPFPQEGEGNVGL